MEKAEATAQLVKEEINSSIFLLESLKKGLINYSELTRQILPKIKANNKKANFASVLIAIQRYYEEVKESEQVDNDNFKEILKNSTLSMKTNIVDLTFERTKEVMKTINEVSKIIRWDLGDIMFVIQGTSEVTIILDKKNLTKFEKIKSKIIEKKDNLALLTLREPEEITSYSKGLIGFLALLTTALSDKGVNIWETATTYKEEIFVIYESDLTKAYEVFKNLIQFYRD